MRWKRLGPDQQETEWEKKEESGESVSTASKIHRSWRREVTKEQQSYSVLSKTASLPEEGATQYGGDHCLDQCEEEEAALQTSI